MARSRRNYTNDEAKTTLRSWLQKNKHTPGSFWHWLDQRGVVVTRQTCHNLFHGHYVAPGPQFKKVFKEITGIVLVDGLIESKGAGDASILRLSQAHTSPRTQKDPGHR